ncbi:MAG: DUF3999 domain-containing protein [Methylophilus sp.]|nr:DUF3999 domain-containing protein [Methylophilus sp.]
MKQVFAILACMLFSLVHAATFKLSTAADEPLYQTRLIKEVYQFSRSDALQDMVITNASGEAIPYALMPNDMLYPQTQMTEENKPLAIFPMQQKQLVEANVVNIQIEKNANSTSLNVASGNAGTQSGQVYLFDLGQQHPALQRLKLDWQGAEDKLVVVEVLSSDNLNEWTHVGNAALLKTAATGAQILQNHIDLDSAIQTRYLQIRPQQATDVDFKLTQVSTEYQHVQNIKLPLVWQLLTFLNRTQNKDGKIAVDFESTGHYPATYLRVHLPQQNTITHAIIYVRSQPNEAWVQVSSAALYRLNKQGKEYLSEDIRLGSRVARYWRLEFDQAHGGLGMETPNLSVGWLPQTFVWNARGAAPYTLHVGEVPKIVNVVAANTLIPEVKREKVLSLPQADLSLASTQPHEATTSWASTPDYKRWWLWGGLFLGVLVLALMAYSLLKTK